MSVHGSETLGIGSTMETTAVVRLLFLDFGEEEATTSILT